MENLENFQTIKKEFEEWLKHFHQHLSTKNLELKSSLNESYQRNEVLKKKIESFKNKVLDSSILSIDVITYKVQSQVDEDVNNLKIKLKQTDICKNTIITKAKDETKKMRQLFYEVITKDDIALKPYHEVEQAIAELEKKIDVCKGQQLEEENSTIKNLKENECYYTEIKESIILLEQIAQEMRHSLQDCNNNFEKKFKSLRLKNIQDANMQSDEAKELLNEISFMKSQLNKE